MLDMSSDGLGTADDWVLDAAAPVVGFGALLSSQCRLVGESEFAIASSTEILPSWISANSACSNDCDPGERLCSSASLIWLISPFAMRSWMCLVLRSTSTAG